MRIKIQSHTYVQWTLYRHFDAHINSNKLRIKYTSKFPCNKWGCIRNWTKVRFQWYSKALGSALRHWLFVNKNRNAVVLTFREHKIRLNGKQKRTTKKRISILFKLTEQHKKYGRVKLTTFITLFRNKQQKKQLSAPAPQMPRKQ